MSRRRLFQALFAAIVALCMLAFSGGVSAQGQSEVAFERVREVQERHTDELMAKPGVVGTAIGEGQGARPIILVLVEHGAVPGIPGQLEDVPVRPLVTGKIYALPKGDNPGGGKGKPGNREPAPDPTSRWARPVPIGVSTGHPDITAGTIGCRVTDGTKVYALSNNHVYANENNATIGDNVLQPGSYDGGIDPDDAIGTLDSFVSIKFDGTDNTVDAAIALSSPAELGTSTPSDGYGTPKSTTATVSFRTKVMKYGRTTGQTSGMVQGTNVIVNVGYDGNKVARFVDQILIGGGGFSRGGDSGSLVVLNAKGADNRTPVGLLFAGGNGFTVANPIDAVLGAFGVSIDGE